MKTQKHSKTEKKIFKPKHGVQSKNLVKKNQQKKKNNGARKNGPRKVQMDELMGKQQLGPFLSILCDFLRPFINNTIRFDLFR